MPKVKYLIIGAGPAGLGAAYRLKELGESDFLVLEQNPWVGGLAASFVDEAGYTWDIGGHVQFSHYPYFDEVMELALGKDGWLHHQRESWVWIRDRFVPYPFQNNVRLLPKDALLRCLRGIIDCTNSVLPPPENFRDWILASFGSGIAEEFMLPYNFKVWAHNLAELDFQWIGERVATIDLNRILENVVYEKDDVSWGPNSTFQFPLRGGTGAIWEGVGKLVGNKQIRNNSTVAAISANERTVTLQDGSRFEFEHLLSTMPLDLMTLKVKELPTPLKQRAGELKHSSSHIVGVGLRGKLKAELATKCWMYFPENNCPFYRVTVFSNYSPNNVPDANECFSLMAETSESFEKPVDQSSIIELTLQGMRNTGLIDESHIIESTWHYRAAYGYPTPSLERDQILADVIPTLDKLGIYSRGRFGAWQYEVSNQDHTFMQGVEWADFIARGKPESTFKLKRAPMVRPNQPAHSNL